MSHLESGDIGRTVKIISAVGRHHHGEVGEICGRDSMPYPGTRLIWYVKARGYTEVYDEEDLELIND